ncbi:MAG: hypothetical protein ABI451_03350, partial [Dokdonella sp.]
MPTDTSLPIISRASANGRDATLRRFGFLHIALIMLGLLGLIRAGALLIHDPLLALANSYDQIRYTGCFNIAPIRPGVAVDRGNPAAPLRTYGFASKSIGVCYWTTDLIFTATVAAGWRLAEQLGSDAQHSVRNLAVLRLLAWLLAGWWSTRVLLRLGREDIALANLAWFALVAMDPVDTLFLATFYAEPTALFGAWLAVIGAVVLMLERSRAVWVVTLIGAALLGGSKYQHVVLPLLLALTLVVFAARAGRRAALAVLVGGILGGGLQLGNTLQHPTLLEDMARLNRADFLLTTLLPHTSDIHKVAEEFDLEPECISHAGSSVYALTTTIQNACPSVDTWTHRQLWNALISDPPALVGAIRQAAPMLLPWVPDYLGTVESADTAPLPTSQPSLNRAFGSSTTMVWGLLLLPWVVFVICLIGDASPLVRGFAAMCAFASLTVATIALFGDG